MRSFDWAVAEEYGNPYDILEKCRLSSNPRSYTLLIDDVPAALFGCYIHKMDEFTYGNIWCFSTTAVDKEARWVARNSRRIIAGITDGCDLSGNMVDSREPAHIRWLQWLGYEVSDTPITGTKLEYAKYHAGTSSSNHNSVGGEQSSERAGRSDGE